MHLLLALAALLVQDAKDPDYFPLAEGAEYEYLGTFNGKEYTDVIVVRTATTDSGLKVFYLVKKADEARENIIIVTSSFGLGAFTRGKDKLLTYEAFWSRDLPKVTRDMAQPLLAFPLKEKAEQKLTAHDGKQVCRTIVAGKEDVTVKAGDYFPLVEGTEYEYQGTFEGDTYKSSLVVRCSGGLSSNPLYYFAEKDDVDKSNYIIGANVFGLGAYAKVKGKIVTCEAFWFEDLEAVKPDTAQALLEFPLKDKAELKLTAHDGKQAFTLTVGGQEDVKVPAGTFKGCWKIAIVDAWPKDKKTYEGAVWLAADVGVVKWLRSTGRVDELVKVTKPK